MITVYKYGALPPTTGGAWALAQLARAHRFYNVLVENERARRARYRAIERSVIPDAVAEAVTACEARVAAGYRALSDARAGLGKHADTAAISTEIAAAKKVLAAARKAYKDHAAPLREAAATVKTAREFEKTARKAARKRDRDDGAIAAMLAPGSLAAKLHESDAAAEAAKREARARSGLAWGMYTLTEDAVAQAAIASPGDPGMPRFKRDFAGEGRVGANAIAGGCTVAELATHSAVRLEMVPLPDGASARMQARRHAICSIRVGDGNVGAEWVTWPVLMHRPLPDGCSIRRAWATRRVVGGRERWEVQFTIDDNQGTSSETMPGRPARAIAIDIGWRKSDADRVAGWVDSDGNYGVVRVPLISFNAGEKRHAQWAKAGREAKPADSILTANDWRLPIGKAIEYIDGIRSARDKEFDKARADVRACIEANGAPEDVRRIAATMHAWRAPERLRGLLRAWERLQPEAPGVALLRIWARQDRHLHEWEAHGRERILATRRDCYRQFAARIARDYDVIIFEEFDLREFARGPEKEDGLPSDDRPLRKAMRNCAPSEFRAACEMAAKREGREVRHEDKAGTSETCHVSGTVETWDNPAALYHTCSCGVTWDRDLNAAVNLLRRAGYPMDGVRILASGEVVAKAA